MGGALHISAEQQSPPSIGIYVAAFSFEAAGLSPLLLCTTSFLGVVCATSQCTQNDSTNEPTRRNQHPAHQLPLSSKRVFRLLRLVIVIAFVLAIVGGSDAGSNKANDRSTGTTLRKVSAILLIVSYATIVAIHALYWVNKDIILRHRRTVRILKRCPAVNIY